MNEVHGAPVSEAGFRDLLARHPVEDWLQVVGKLSRRLDDLPPPSRDLDEALAGHLGPLEQPALRRIGQGGRFVTSATLNTLAREALFWGSDGFPRGFDDQGTRDLARALLGVVDLFEDRRP